MEETIARLFQIFLALAGAYLLALWFALAVWTYRDITSRSTNPIVQIFSTLIVVLFFAPGAIIYLILRPRETLDEAFQRSMEEEYLVQDLEEFPLCPSCRRAIRDDFVYCPNCHVELRQACSSCRRLIDLRWDLCPYCGTDQFAGPPLLAEVPRDEASQFVWGNRQGTVRSMESAERPPQETSHRRAQLEPDQHRASGAWNGMSMDGARDRVTTSDDSRVARGVSGGADDAPGSAPRPAESGS